MTTDPYIKEYLLQNGYSKEQTESPRFNLDSLKDNFSEPLNLAEISNIEDLQIFLAVHVDFVVTQEDIDMGKVYELSKVLVNYGLIASEKELRLDKLFIPDNSTVIFRKESGWREQRSKKIVLKDFILHDLEIIKGVNKYGNYIILDESLESNRYVDENEKNLALGLEFENCEGVDFEKFEEFSLAVSCKGCNEVTCPNGMNLRSLNLDGCMCSNLESIVVDYLTVANVEEFDLFLSSVPLKGIELKNIERCNIQGEMNFPSTTFSGVNFVGNKAVFSTNHLSMDNCTISDSTQVFRAETMNVDKCAVLDVGEIFCAQRINIKNCEFNTIMATLPVNSLTISNCTGFDGRFEEIVSALYEKKCFVTAKEIDGYDARRMLMDLDLNAEENRDLLKDIEALRKVLENNIFLRQIHVSPSLTVEAKQLLGEVAPDKIYYYGTIMTEDFNQGLGENLGYDNNWEMFLGADKVYDEIILGINPEWSELEKFKYLYDELGKKISYDINVLNEHNSEAESYTNANNIARNALSEILTKNGVCYGYAVAYEYLCRKAGLQCYEIGGIGYPQRYSEENHAWNFIQYTENEEVKSCFCDLTWDALRTKVGMKCEYFGFGFEDEDHKVADSNMYKVDTQSVQQLSLEEVIEVDEAIGHSDYKEEAYRNLSNSSEQKIYTLLKAMMRVQDLSHLSNNEISGLATKVLVFNGYDKDDVGFKSAFIRKNALADKEERTFLWAKQKDEQGKDSFEYFTLNPQQQEFKPMDRELIEEFLAAGMIEFYEGERLPGFENWISDKEYYSRGHDVGSMER